MILVSSGAIGIGMRRLDIEKRPKHLAVVQVSRFEGFLFFIGREGMLIWVRVGNRGSGSVQAYCAVG